MQLFYNMTEKGALLYNGTLKSTSIFFN